MTGRSGTRTWPLVIGYAGLTPGQIRDGIRLLAAVIGDTGAYPAVT
jgi:hypothetical protein